MMTISVMKQIYSSQTMNDMNHNNELAQDISAYNSLETSRTNVISWAGSARGLPK